MAGGARPGAGRPTKKTPALLDEIISRIGQGMYVAQICREDPEMPDKNTVFRWLCDDDDFATRYTRAKKNQADAIEDDLAELERQVLIGDVDANAARVVAQSRQWRAQRLNPTKYGDRKTVAGDPESPIRHAVSLESLDPETLRAVRDAARKLAGG